MIVKTRPSQASSPIKFFSLYTIFSLYTMKQLGLSLHVVRMTVCSINMLDVHVSTADVA